MNTPLIENSKYKINFKNKANGLNLLKDINDSSIKVAFFDPQYRGVLDKLHYGNEGKGRAKEEDFILDPASGGYSVFECCKSCNRNFIGGDIEFGE